MRFILLSILLSSLGIMLISPLAAQNLDHVLGEIIVQVPNRAALDRVVATSQEFEGMPTKMRIKKKIAPSFEFYLLKFDYQNIHEERFLNFIKNHELVEVAQLNHIIQYRATPNDTDFPFQWQYINDGTNGAVAGADIDADLAWDITTGGLTALGDTIVVAVVDDGLDLSHQDFEDNHWLNHAEIPNNGIDDDNNGYVDDYLGWNADANNDNIGGGFAGGHGTPVAGIVGAKGNNNLGVAGVNWDVKLMIIQGGGNEAQAIAAYSYAHDARKRYNETGGAEGAFVVATNSSWGIDGGQPADAPLWCAFYDTLGLQGVMNCGATINGNQNVDDFGDLPTACPGDFLISVTNMNSADQKVNQAGYGATTIDLGAFGQDTWTCAYGNNYAGFGGTSGATPHVAGAVALMYAAPCPSLAAFAKADPGAAALQVRQAILDGVDPNASLEGITVTEGRLNVNNSLQLILTNCDTSGCFSPYSLAANNIIDVSANLSWQVGSETDTTNLRWRAVGASTWNELLNVGIPPLTLSGLTACTDYEFQAQAICNGNVTNYSNSYTFQTEGCCVNPSNLQAENISSSGADLTWNSVFAALSYNIQYKSTSASTWITANTTATTLSISNLDSCTTYEVQLQTVCSSNSVDFSESYLFTTTGCGACVDNAYCESAGNDASYEWIEDFSINTINNISGLDDGYGDYTNLSTTLTAGESYEFTVSPGFSQFTYDEYFKIWIDYNQDGVFDELTELAYDQGGVGDQPITDTIDIPSNALEGATRLRVSMKFDGEPTPCESFEYGEVEDYCITIAAGSSCNIPSGVNTSNVDGTNFDLNWEAVSEAIGYELRWREVGTPAWFGDASATTTFTIVGVDSCSIYESQVRTICGLGVSDWSLLAEAATDCSVNTTAFNTIGGFDILPNPASDNIQIELELVEAGDTYIVFFDVNGKEVKQTTLGNLSAGSHSFYSSVADFPMGMYFVKIIQNDKVALAKLLVN